MNNVQFPRMEAINEKFNNISKPLCLNIFNVLFEYVIGQKFVMIQQIVEFHHKGSLKATNVCGNCHSCKSQIRELHMRFFIIIFLSAVHCGS